MMRIINKIISTILLAILTQMAVGLPSKDSLNFEILLTDNMLRGIQANEPFINSIDFTSNRLILLSTTNQFYLLGWGGIQPLGKRLAGNIGSYAFTQDKFLMVVRNKELCAMDSLGNLSKLFKLPSEGMGICSGKYVMYVYDCNKEKTQHALYVVAKGGKYAKLFEVPSPILSVVEFNNSILFTTGNGLFSFNPKNKVLKALISLPKNEEIISIAVDSSGNRIYFSTENSIYALKDSSVVIITDGLNGQLRFFNDGLIVFNPEKKLLIRIVGLEKEIASKKMQKINTTPTPTIAPITTAVNPINVNPVSEKKYFIIIGSFKTVQEANAVVSSMKDKGFINAEVVGKSNAGTWRVSYKSFASKEEAMKELPNIEQSYPSAWIFADNK